MTRLRLYLTIILAIAYFGFLLLGAFAQTLLATPVYQSIPLSFLLGLILIVTCIVLTGLYAVACNRNESA